MDKPTSIGKEEEDGTSAVAICDGGSCVCGSCGILQNPTFQSVWKDNTLRKQRKSRQEGRFKEDIRVFGFQ